MTPKPSPSTGRDQRLAERDRRRAAHTRTNAIVVGSLVAFALAVAGVIGALAFGVGAPPAKPVAAVSVGAPAPTTESGPRAVAVQSAASSPTTEAPVPSPAPTASRPQPKASAVAPRAKPKPRAAPAPQHLTIAIGQTGYEPSVVRATAGRPITLTVGKGEGCAAGFLMPSLGVNKDNSSGPVSIKLGALKPGTYRFSCAMDMVEGQLVVR